MTEELAAAMRIWRRVKDYGWPQGKGYLSEPEAVRAVVELLDAERSSYLAWERNRNEPGTYGRA
ncbi:MAG: hypothetical protein IK015_04485 [Treponema sp.]|nr:hypothetical protein [Treponema sp.]